MLKEEMPKKALNLNLMQLKIVRADFDKNIKY
jgi:hypothetical protein